MFNIPLSVIHVMAKSPHIAFPTLTAEDRLRDYAHRLRRHRKGRLALRIRLSALTRTFRQDRILRPVQVPLLALMDGDKGQLFSLQSKDLICIATAPKSAFESAMLKITYLLRDDERVKKAIDRGEENTFLFQWFDLSDAYDEFLAYANQPAAFVPPDPEPDDYPAETTLHNEPLARVTGPTLPQGYVTLVHKKAPSPKKQMDLASCAQLENAVRTADVTGFIRRESVMLLHPDRAERALMQSVSVNVAAVFDSLMPDYKLEMESWFGRSFIALLSERLLVSQPDLSTTGLSAVLLSTSLQLIGQQVFAQFVAQQERCKHNNRLIAAIDYHEASCAPLSYERARVSLSRQQLGCALIHHDPLQFAMRDRALLPSDMDSLDWTRLREWEESGDWRFDHIMHAIRTTDPARLILAGCDEQYALDLGRKLGVRLFSGPYIRENFHNRGA